MLNMNFSERVVIHTVERDWFASPETGVSRKLLARERTPSGHATSIVQYTPGARFPRHSHPGGEEIFVLAGVFSDEHGDYPAGTYLRNPPGSSHEPYSESGCTLFVKLSQFAAEDTEAVRINTDEGAWFRGHGDLIVMPLHHFETENTALVFWPAGEAFVPHRHYGGEEIFVLKGRFRDEHGEYPAHTWLRNPHLSTHHPFVTEDTLILVKTGHLPQGRMNAVDPSELSQMAG